MRNTYKYTRLYSDSEPIFLEGDVFRTIIPLTDAATATVGPLSNLQDNAKDNAVNLAGLIEFCSIPRTKAEMMVYAKLINSSYFHKAYLKPLLNSGKIRMKNM